MKTFIAASVALLCVACGQARMVPCETDIACDSEDYCDLEPDMCPEPPPHPKNTGRVSFKAKNYSGHLRNFQLTFTTTTTAGETWGRQLLTATPLLPGQMAEWPEATGGEYGTTVRVTFAAWDPTNGYRRADHTLTYIIDRPRLTCEFMYSEPGGVPTAERFCESL